MPGLLLAALIIGGGSAYAFSGGERVLPEEVLNNFSSEQQEAIKKARQILEDAGVSMEDLHKAMKEARGEFKDNREEVQAAIEAEDYEAFVEAVAGTPGEGKVTEEQFGKLVEAHALMKSGDKAGAFEIMKEVGFPGVRGHMMNK